MDLNEMSGVQRKLLRQAISSAFTRQALNKLLQEDIGKSPLQNLVAAGAFDDELFELIKLSQMDGWTDALIEAAQEKAPNNPRIKNLFSHLGLIAVEGNAAATRRHCPDGAVSVADHGGNRRTGARYRRSPQYSRWLLSRTEGRAEHAAILEQSPSNLARLLWRQRGARKPSAATFNSPTGLNSSR